MGRKEAQNSPLDSFVVTSAGFSVPGAAGAAESSLPAHLATDPGDGANTNWEAAWIDLGGEG